ncbi:MAG: sugar kinase [Puia sp.]|nr:sugar kinase [Puia sp.]
MILTFGETLLRLTPDNPYERLASASQLKMGFAGAESNTAAALARLGHLVYHVTAFPENLLGDAAINSLRHAGIQTDYITRSGDRIGAYFIEAGASLRPSRVVYDRAHSSFSEIDAGHFDWKEIFAKKQWFHISGITPALSPACDETALHAVKEAKQAGVTVSFDFNFRRTLWKDKSQAAKSFDRLLQYTDYVFANEGAVKDVFDIGIFDGQDNAENAAEAIRALQTRYGLKGVAFTLREQYSASFNKWSALACIGGQFFYSPVYDIEVVERLGGGDTFGAGLIHGIISGWDPGKILGFATAAAALKHTIPGDIGFLSEKEIFSVMEGNTQGKIER